MFLIPVVGFYTSNRVPWGQSWSESNKYYRFSFLSHPFMSDWHPWSACLTFFSQMMSSIFQKMHDLQLLQNQRPDILNQKTLLCDLPWLSVRPWTGSPQHLPKWSALSSSVHLGHVIFWASCGHSISQTLAFGDNCTCADCWTNHLLHNLVLLLITLF